MVEKDGWIMMDMLPETFKHPYWEIRSGIEVIGASGFSLNLNKPEISRE